MAVPSSPAAPSSSRKKKMNGDKEVERKTDRIEADKDKGSKQSKRTKCPGIRVVSGRIYDSQNGKTCHQCRQKTMDFAAGCKNTKHNKQCMIKFCHKCLLNRYGEKDEEVAALKDWKCPKCRGICNCSFCMKKRGHKPTGILVHTAKATGFSSVSHLLDVKGHDTCQEMTVHNKITSPKKLAVSTEGPVVASPKKRGKENTFDGTCNGNSNSQATLSSPNEKKAKKAKRDELRDRVKVAKYNGTSGSPRQVTKGNAIRSPRKSEISHEVTRKEEKMNGDICGIPAVNVTKAIKKEKKTKVQAEPKAMLYKLNKDKSMDGNAVDVVLPIGTLLMNVSGIDLLPGDVGYALQFLEFCSIFGEVLDIRKGQPESVLRDILGGRSRRKGKCSSAIQFLIQLLSIIPKDMEENSPYLSPTNGKDSWIHSIKRCLSESECELKDIPEGCFDKGCDGYEMLEPSQKLRLLTFLCDETLCTMEMRKWIDEQNSKFAEKAKEARETLNAAKEKEKLIKRKLQDKVAKTIIAKSGAPLTISDHDSMFSQIKAEADRARAEMLEAMDLVPKKKQRSDAVRTEPVLLDDNSRSYWRLKCFSDSHLLLQDMGGGSEQTASNEKWFSFNTEEMKVIQKHISSVRLKRQWRNKLADPTMMKSSNSVLQVDSSS